MFKTRRVRIDVVIGCVKIILTGYIVLTVRWRGAES